LAKGDRGGFPPSDLKSLSVSLYEREKLSTHQGRGIKGEGCPIKN